MKVIPFILSSFTFLLIQRVASTYCVSEGVCVCSEILYCTKPQTINGIV